MVWTLGGGQRICVCPWKPLMEMSQQSLTPCSTCFLSLLSLFSAQQMHLCFCRWNNNLFFPYISHYGVNNIKQRLFSGRNMMFSQKSRHLSHYIYLQLTLMSFNVKKITTFWACIIDTNKNMFSSYTYDYHTAQ